MCSGIKGVLVYMLVYTFMNLGAFLVLGSLSARVWPEKTSAIRN